MIIQPGDKELFVYPARSAKIACRVCGRRGYADGRWMDACRRGHLPCPRCGKQLSVLPNGNARAHARCPTPS